jgi:hypothetical protein
MEKAPFWGAFFLPYAQCVGVIAAGEVAEAGGPASNICSMAGHPSKGRLAHPAGFGIFHYFRPAMSWRSTVCKMPPLR